MINKAILMGRLTRDPELRHTGSGTAVCSFSIAINSGNGESQTTDYINCVAWNKTGEFVNKYFTKGRMIIVVGKIRTRTWDGQNGKKRYATEVEVNEVSFGESKRADDPPSVSTADSSLDEGAFTGLEVNDDLPF